MLANINDFKDEVLQQLETCINESTILFELVNQEIDITYQKYKINKKFKHKNKNKQDWYYKHLKDRIRKRVYRKYKIDFFGVLQRNINNVLPKIVGSEFIEFTDVRYVNLGKR